MTQLTMGLIKLYQNTVSKVLPSVCRFQPTCSHYAFEAIKKYHEERKMTGILINDELFLSEGGIRRRYINNQDYISMETVFTERTLNEEEEKLAISILENLVNK